MWAKTFILDAINCLTALLFIWVKSQQIHIRGNQLILLTQPDQTNTRQRAIWGPLLPAAPQTASTHTVCCSNTFNSCVGPHTHTHIPHTHTHLTLTHTHTHSYIYIYAFSRRFYPKSLTVHSAYTFIYFFSVCVFPGNLTRRPFALLTQCSATEPQYYLLFTCL